MSREKKQRFVLEELGRLARPNVFFRLYTRRIKLVGSRFFAA
jgi:hypothetical protein